MPVSSDISPNTNNLVLSTGIVKWKGPGDSDYRDIGEVMTFDFTLDVTEKEHISKRHGARIVDFTVTERVGGTLTMTLQEMTSDNVVLALLGTKAVGGPPVSIVIGTNTEIVGSVRFIGTNNVGPRAQVDFVTVKITPTKGLNLLSDDWGNIELVGKVYGDPVTGSFGTYLNNITVEVP